MSRNPLNLALRFLLEIAALGAMGYWGWTQFDGWARWLLMPGVPLLAATLWGLFRVDGDPKDAPVRVPGWLRLLLEAAFFGSAVLLLTPAGRPTWALIFGLVVVGHYVISYDRVLWLLRQK